MNQRNVNALTRLLGEADAQHWRDHEFPAIVAERDRWIAKSLASRGVLVPSSLTDREVADLFDVPPGHATTRRQYLEQLAKGEGEGP